MMIKPFFIFSKIRMLVFFICIIFTSCSSNDSDSLEEQKTQNSLHVSAIINDSEFSAKNFVGLGDSSDAYFSIKGFNENESEGIDFTLPSSFVGTYAATGNKDTQAIATYFIKNIDGILEYYAVLSGTITITENIETSILSRRVKGHFNFNCSREGIDKVYKVTNGSFNIEISSL